MTRSTRWRVEVAIAVLFALGVTVVGGGAVWLFSMMPVHADPAEIPSRGSVATEPYANAIEESRRVARELMLEGNLPGLSVAVAHDGEIVWAEGFGWANVERREPVTPLTRFRLGSVSKTLTAAAVLVLHERGHVNLDAPVQAYVPDYPLKQWPVTVRQLMGDVAGVHRIHGDTDADQTMRGCRSLEEVVATLASEPLLFQPGTQYRYANNGWILLSAVVEGAAGEPFGTAMTREVFEPLKMKSTVPGEAGAVPDLTTFYFPKFSLLVRGPREAPPEDYSCLFGAGAFVSTPSDLAQFGSAMVKPGLLNAESIALLQTPLTLASGASTGFALGWKVETVPLAGAPARMVAHRARVVGSGVALLTFPDHDLVVAVASNMSFADVDQFGRTVAEAFTRRQ